MDPETFTVEARPFESNFFDLSICRLGINRASDPALFARELASFVGDSDHDVIETNLDLRDLSLASALEDHDFRLVDSRITFITLVSVDDPDVTVAGEDSGFDIRMLTDDDLDQVVELTHANLTDNPGFVSRYKNEGIFGDQSARRWFGAWIRDSAGNESARTAVAEVGGDVVAFFTYQKQDHYADGLPLYRGILSAVDPAYRGHHLHILLQPYLFDAFPESSFYVQNATQLSNYAVIKNHIRSNRHLEHCELTYMRTRSARREQ